MINLRYHIVSITAVFLALAIGIALGSTLLERATVGTLNDRLDAQAERLDKTDGENARLRRDKEAEARRQAEVYTQARALFAGHLTDQVVLIVAVQGTDDDLVEEARSALVAAGAVVPGVLQISSRWNGLSADEAMSLARAVGLTSANETVVRSIVINRLADELGAAAKLPAASEEGESDELGEVDLEGTGSGDDSPTPDGAADGAGLPNDVLGLADAEVIGTTGEEVGPEQDLEAQAQAQVDGDADIVTNPEAPTLQALLDLGYLEFFGDNSAVPLPAFNMRMVILTDDSSSLSPSQFMTTLVRGLSRGGAAPALIVGPLKEEDHEGDEIPVLSASEVIVEIRSDSALRERVSTVDNLNEFTGQAALVLGLRDLFGDDVKIGHYGRAPDSGLMIPQLGNS
ncbi:MAG: copper transporter [Acidimicrobiia bacterium]